LFEKEKEVTVQNFGNFNVCNTIDLTNISTLGECTSMNTRQLISKLFINLLFRNYLARYFIAPQASIPWQWIFCF
jgi:hypothetical protein